VKDRALQYGNASKTDKTQISANVVQTVKDEFGGRFIQKEEDTMEEDTMEEDTMEEDTDSPKWFIAHDKTVREKVSQVSRPTAGTAMCFG
jgi:hypothetical protein